MSKRIIQAFGLLCVGAPPSCAARLLDGTVSDDELYELQCWAASNSRCEWATGIGIIDAVEALVRGSSDTLWEYEP